MNPIKCYLAEKRGDKWVRLDTGEEFESNHQLPVGAIYRVPWYESDDGTPNDWTGTDGKSYICIIPEKPDGSGWWPWHIDGPCNNCTMPNDHVHKCWCRHGEAPNFHVDKVGFTCSAGAGSIITSGGFHGFLHHGHIVSC